MELRMCKPSSPTLRSIWARLPSPAPICMRRDGRPSAATTCRLQYGWTPYDESLIREPGRGDDPASWLAHRVPLPRRQQYRRCDRPPWRRRHVRALAIR
eukprot:2508684-Prymnesium_polylepis.1